MKLSVLVLICVSILGCQKMASHGKLKPEAAIQPAPEGTVPREVISEAQPPRTFRLLQRGKERFEIYCAPCHGILGDGSGVITRRGLLSPPTYHQERLRTASDAHFYEVISQGTGAMFSYADRVEPEDRWAIVAYIRALQRSQNTPFANLAPRQRTQLQARRSK